MSTKVYFAGCLFDLRHLAGNALLGEAIEGISSGRYKMYLPQDYELPSYEAKAIRDCDFKGLLDCGAAIFQFDGTELDSGTVAEFMAAKFADIPSVLLRTDFRKGGDRNDDPWNLMCSFYPRTENLVVDAMGLYAKHLEQEGSGSKASVAACEELAKAVVSKLDATMALPPVKVDRSKDGREQLKALIGFE